MLWHIGKDKKVRRCRAKDVGSCPLKSSHYDSPEKAEKALAEREERTNKLRKSKPLIADKVVELDLETIPDTIVNDVPDFALNRGEIAEFVSVVDSVVGDGNVITENCGFNGSDVYGVRYANADIYNKDGYLIISRNGVLSKTPLNDVIDARSQIIKEFSMQSRLDDDLANANVAKDINKKKHTLAKMKELGYKKDHGQFVYPGVMRMTALLRGTDKNSIKENLDKNDVTKADVDLLVKGKNGPISVSLKSIMRSGTSPTLFSAVDATEVAIKFNPPDKSRMDDYIDNQKRRIKRARRALSRMDDYDDADRIAVQKRRINIAKRNLSALDTGDPAEDYKNYTNMMWKYAMRPLDEEMSEAKSTRKRLIDAGFTPDYNDSKLVGVASGDASTPTGALKLSNAKTFQSNLSKIAGNNGVSTWAKLNDSAVQPDSDGSFDLNDKNALHIASALSTNMIATSEWTSNEWRPEYVGVTTVNKENDGGLASKTKHVNGISTKITGYRTLDDFEKNFIADKVRLKETAYESSTNAKNRNKILSHRDMTGTKGFEDGYYWTLNVSGQMVTASDVVDAKKGKANNL